MKCIRKDKEVKRVDDQLAVRLIEDGWQYCPKILWKLARREAKTPQEVDAVLEFFGYDPDEVGQRMKKAAKEAMSKQVWFLTTERE